MKKETLSQETKRQILLSAKKEFAENGFAGARMDSIAKKSKVNKAMLHYYFGNKEQLYKEVIEYLVKIGVKSDVIKIKTMSMDLKPPEKLALMMYCIVNNHFTAIDSDFHRIIAWDFAEGKNAMESLIKDYFAPALKRLADIVEEGIKTGDFETQNPLLSVWSFIVFIIAYINQMEIYKNSEIYESLYGQNPQENILNFLMTHIFKALKPGNKTEIPNIPKEALDYYLEKVKDSIKSEGFCL